MAMFSAELNSLTSNFHTNFALDYSYECTTRKSISLRIRVICVSCEVPNVCVYSNSWIFELLIQQQFRTLNFRV